MSHTRKAGLLSLLVLTVLILAPSVVAQESEPKEAESEGVRPYEVFGGYTHLRDDGGLNGWTGSFIFKVNGWFGLAADADGHYGSHRKGLEVERVREHAVTFGPHFALENRSRFTPFAFALFGGAHENAKTAGVTESATGFAANFGGGLDMRLNERWSVNLIQFDASYTRFHGEGKTAPRFATGLVYRFGKPR